MHFFISGFQTHVERLYLRLLSRSYITNRLIGLRLAIADKSSRHKCPVFLQFSVLKFHSGGKVVVDFFCTEGAAELQEGGGCFAGSWLVDTGGEGRGLGVWM